MKIPQDLIWMKVKTTVTNILYAFLKDLIFYKTVPQIVKYLVMGRNHPQHKRTKRSSENTTRRRQGSIEQETANPPPQSPPIQQPRHSQDQEQRQQPRHSQDQDEVPRTSRSQAARLSEQVEANRLSQIAEEAKSQPVKLTALPPMVPKPKRSELDWEKKDSLGKSPSADNLHRESNAPRKNRILKRALVL